MAGFTRWWLESGKLDLERIAGRRVDLAAEPPREKEYPEAPKIRLIPPETIDVKPADLWALLHKRRSKRRYAKESLTLGQLSALLWSCQGVTARQGHYLLRTAPSAGALYPFETYVLLSNVEGVEPCLGHLNVGKFELEVVRTGSLGGELSKAALNQRFLAAASVVVIWTAVWERCEWKYSDRASRYIGLDIGHVCQNLCLAAEALGLASCPVGAFLDDPMNELMQFDTGMEAVFYLCSVGRAG